MATAKSENESTEVKSFDFDDSKRNLALDIGMSILAKRDYFDRADHAATSKLLRNFQEYVNGLVTEHDKLADETGNVRIVGKRGRKASASKVETVDDVMARLSK